MKCSASSTLGRRAFLQLSGLATLGTCLRTDTWDILESDPTHCLHIREAQVELAPGRVITTTTYDGQLPGPLLRTVVGQPVRVDVYNETDRAERVNWQGQHLAEDACFVPARSVRRMEFTPARPGPFLYHSNVVAAARLDAGLYSGQAGVLLVEPAALHHREREELIVLKDCEPFIRRTRRGCEIGYRSVTINGRLPEHAEVPSGRTLLHVLNASATETRTLGLPGHCFEVTALDGNPLPAPTRVDALQLGPGERVSARVKLNRPSGWTVRDVESGGPACWDYARFGAGQARTPDVALDMFLTRQDAARSGFNRWSINGASFSTSGSSPLFRLRCGLRHRLRLHNRSDELLPVHLQHHQLEIVRVADKPTAGIFKDVVSVGAGQSLEVDFVTHHSGSALLYCTRQLHRDFGLMALLDSAL